MVICVSTSFVYVLRWQIESCVYHMSVSICMLVSVSVLGFNCVALYSKVRAGIGTLKRNRVREWRVIT